MQLWWMHLGLMLAYAPRVPLTVVETSQPLRADSAWTVLRPDVVKAFRDPALWHHGFDIVLHSTEPISDSTLGAIRVSVAAPVPAEADRTRKIDPDA